MIDVCSACDDRNGRLPGASWKSNLERSLDFFEHLGMPMLHELFPQYEERIAVGLVGEGSDCYGFDDEISEDHDYEPGFCMWLTDEDYDKIGSSLQEAYEKMVAEYMGQKRTDAGNNNRFLGRRRGVFTINAFYNQLLGTRDGASIDYRKTQEFQLAAATNGAVFRDALGVFSKVRGRLLSYYPDRVWYEKLAGSLHEYAQYAQSNYARMMARGDLITAKLCIAKGVETAMDLLYLLNRRYAPYYKWKRKGLEQSTQALLQNAQIRHLETENAGKAVSDSTITAVLALLDKLVMLPPQSHAWRGVHYSSASLNLQDECVCLFEQVAELLLGEMRRLGLTDGEDLFLENYVGQMIHRGMQCEREASEKGTERLPASGGVAERGMRWKAEEGESDGGAGMGADMKNELVEQIVELEWEQFDKVKNEGGRADCQDNFPTFSIMRRSQYLAWPEELLESYREDLMEAKNRGWNLIMEKYARMMKSTAPAKYAELESELPVRSPERIAIMEEIIRLQVNWMEDFAHKYPKMADNARSIRTEEDNEYNTSYETYLRGEVGTYSENTFVLYGRFVVGLAQAGRNLAYEIMENTAHLYGYESVEDAESRLAMG